MSTYEARGMAFDQGLAEGLLAAQFTALCDNENCAQPATLMRILRRSSLRSMARMQQRMRHRTTQHAATAHVPLRVRDSRLMLRDTDA